ncbi:MAG: mandelate racemase, partial [Caldimonas sp.]
MVPASPAPPFAPKVQVLGVEAFEQPFRLRMPFRFGAVTLTEGRQAHVRVQLRLDDGREGFGYAAEMLAPKWFDKNPAFSDEDNRHQLRKAIEIAADAYRDATPSTPFDLYADNYRYQLRAGRGVELPPLAASFGNAVLDRAVLDAVCRLFGVSFWTAMRSNL